MSHRIAERALKKTKSGWGNGESSGGRPWLHGYILEETWSPVRRGKSCDSQSFPGGGDRDGGVPEMETCLVCVEQQQGDNVAGEWR